MKKVLVTGTNGQLGKTIHKLHSNYPELKFIFTSSKELDITDSQNIESVFNRYKPDYCINSAAYTNVEQAEKEPEKAFKVNAEGVKNLALVCLEFNTILIHISTDYVFDGKKRTPYSEEDVPNPINEYGKSKLLGEQYIQDILKKHFIIRTSWLYSEYGKNFLKTIIEKSKNEKQLTIVDSEIGTPTNANNMVKFILNLICINSDQYGIYHYSDEGEASWYNFAQEILIISGKLGAIHIEKTDYYPTFAKRPKYSVLSKEKIKRNFNTKICAWEECLKEIITILL